MDFFTLVSTIFCPTFGARLGQQEVDYIEELDGQLTVFEIKWNPNAKAKLPDILNRSYIVSSFEVITPENYDLYLS